jgi:hypothetical protein
MSEERKKKRLLQNILDTERSGVLLFAIAFIDGQIKKAKLAKKVASYRKALMEFEMRYQKGIQ